MSSSNHRRANHLARQTVELSLAAPQVIAHRVARMAAAGLAPSSADQKEFTLMGAEKIAAFGESWLAIYWQSVQAQQNLWLGLWQQGTHPADWLQPWTGGQRMGSLWQKSVLDIMGKGIDPVRRRAVANARRLGRKRK